MAYGEGKKRKENSYGSKCMDTFDQKDQKGELSTYKSLEGR